jgi:SAM-dependent methyltransferase
MDRLNLGCGEDIREGYVNVDYINSEGVNRVVNLDKFPYPFKNNSFKEIVMHDIFEHLSDPINVLEEIFRISKNHAIIKIRVPHFSSGNTWSDLTHKRAFSIFCFGHFLMESRTTSLENKRAMRFKIVKKELQFPAPYRFLGFNRLFSRFPKIYERMFYGLFPCGNICFELEVVKD